MDDEIGSKLSWPILKHYLSACLAMKTSPHDSPYNGRD